MSTNASLDARVANFETAVKPKLQVVLNGLKKGDPTAFKRIAEDQSVVDVVFVGFENKSPRLILRYFHAHSSEKSVDITIGRKNCPGDCDSGIAYAAIGHHDAVDAEIARDPAIWAHMGLEGAIQHLVQSEIDRYPDVAGPPIAILELTAQGPNWIQKGKCQ